MVDEPRAKVEIDLEKFQEGILKMTVAMRDIGFAFEQMNAAQRMLNRSLSNFFEATQTNSRDVDPD